MVKVNWLGTERLPPLVTRKQKNPGIQGLPAQPGLNVQEALQALQLILEICGFLQQRCIIRAVFLSPPSPKIRLVTLIMAREKLSQSPLEFINQEKRFKNIVSRTHGKSVLVDGQFFHQVPALDSHCIGIKKQLSIFSLSHLPQCTCM